LLILGRDHFVTVSYLWRKSVLLAIGLLPGYSGAEALRRYFQRLRVADRRLSDSMTVLDNGPTKQYFHIGRQCHQTDIKSLRIFRSASAL
jgi:hypothetical protein